MEQKIIIIVMQLKQILVCGHCKHYSSQTINNQFMGTKENNNIIYINYQYNITNIKHTIYLLGY